MNEPEIKQDLKSNHIKNVLHGFFIAIGTTIAEPHTILPLMINFFGGSPILIGLFSSLLRGGAILVQLYAAFYAQSYPLVLKYIRKIFFIRFLAWFFIGVSIILFGKDYPNLTLFCIGTGLFIFSFSAGFGMIFFREIQGKIFTHKFRGKSMATRQFFAAFASILSGSAAGLVLESTDAPFSFGILFIVSSLLMGFGFVAFGTVKEPIKQKISQKEKSFREFLKNAFKILKSDKTLQIQISTFLLAFSYLFAIPFIIIDAKDTIELNGTIIGTLITVQMTGSMLSNLVWGKLSSDGKNKLTANITITLFIISIFIAIFANSFWHYIVIFFLFGAAIDGNRISSSNLILIIAPEEKRPIYTALQQNIISIGLFFSIVGGVVLHFTSFTFLYLFSIFFLAIALFLSFRLKDI